ncbi:4-alpha-glucanotransferase [bacterium (Candidatus Blackallbacteria) CG17_big_fil_post_rev_8_21_14_2_50_48_46]|uniref:4-alpha-glucanotransferase n=1 Tax=bacterium (Candidatus Blackallbacteria) CG17_big_fil_post_rev_8_21_14_2_50_48_46 TaxID=2014261 RepID=A0A2M7FXN9_9BACT|nr:MAG: 4-alpha-glucanotransferase [bacterium (Candidatus Blackallbacteria) CG18_big_fil_WC_8_21_14_2_50_49_26]PIW14037.1 MAG: 4-alpha-glucanotransferase [bacterium (Candidatus Blackallbacteria) CG17_big_fil_post_rev_8_21_14_2_50_48_46]PIW50743.1 MAG: 4-alpha-glucanotransferase [bacterium (Candidatus Blackallbacteria) CG13_big_fil_rev_8_21_14_2_50_49_14]
MYPRASGILLHPTSLPGPFGIGDLGEIAYDFLDFMAETGQKLWQVMPLGPTGYGDSPYACLSAFAGNPLLISPQKLVEKGLLSPESPALQNYPELSREKVEFEAVAAAKKEIFEDSFAHFRSYASISERKRFNNFCQCQQNHNWLHNYALFASLKEHYAGEPWDKWNAGLIRRDPDTVSEFEQVLAERILYHKYLQYLFYTQWNELRSYAHLNGIHIIGDMPIFLAHDSADVWAHQSLFHLDAHGKPTVVAGVPPDYFSATGQLWGNPLYHWEAMAKDNYAWWAERFRVMLNLVDIVRLDHFRGFEAYWEIPAGEETAINGKWVKGPNKAFFKAMQKALGNLPFIAEDLGVITPPVEDLRDSFGFPGMKVLQFAFDDTPENAFLPHNHIANSVVYTGTHDNQTTLSWFEDRPEKVKQFILGYQGSNDANFIHWQLIRLALSSVANTVLIPLQDILGLPDESARMNTPGKAEGNWSWRLKEEDLTSEVAHTLKHWTQLYNR